MDSLDPISNAVSYRSLLLKLQFGKVVAEGRLSYQRRYSTHDVLDATIVEHLGRFFDVVQFVKYDPSRGPLQVPIKLSFVFYQSSPQSSPEKEDLDLVANLLVRGPGSSEENRKVIINRIAPVVKVESFPDKERNLLRTIKAL